MNAALQQPQYDELGLPLLPSGARRYSTEDVDDDIMESFAAADFSALGLPMPSSMPTREEAQREARERSADVLSSWNTLQQILERHEEVIRKRWTKKTKVQRGKIISGLWPNMAPSHRPDYTAFFKESQTAKNGNTKFRNSYLMPYMNVEDLVKNKTLLLFLNSRGRHPPSMFAHADFAATRVGHVSGILMPAFLNVHTMILDGETIETYGRLVSWDEDEDAMDKMFCGLQHQPGQGLWILEIQQQVLRFLVQCCRSILHEFTPTSLTSTEIPIKSEPPPIVDTSEYPTLATMAAEAPYRVPAKVDFIRLKSLAAAKLTSSEDYIRALREDPGYFSDVMRDWSEHRQEQILDTNHHRHPVLDRPLFWDRVIGTAVSDAYGNLILWNIISDQLNHLSTLQVKYSNVIDPQHKLPPEYMKALLTLKYTLDQAAKSPILLLKTGLVASPPLRSSFVREPHIPGTTGIRVQSKKGSDQLMWLFSKLWDDQQLRLLGLPGLADEIESLVERDQKEKAKLSPWVAQVFSDIGLIAHVQHELELYQPWAAGYDNAEVDHRDAIQKEFPRRFSKVADIVSHLGNVPFAKFGAPTEGRFYYPSDKRRTQQNVESMREAEKHLDIFWEKVDEVYQKKNGKSLEQGVQYLFKDRRPLERTEIWVEPIKESKRLAMERNEQDLSQPLSALQLGSVDSSSRFVPPQEKVKPKTRGTTRDVPGTTTEPAVATRPEDTQPTFKLKNRSFKVFKSLFYKPSQNDLPGEILWADFLFAMVATGFAPEKLYGSVWQFTPSHLDVERSIQFHEPHPVGKIPFRNARRIGRRLNRAYGWHGGMFALE